MSLGDLLEGLDDIAVRGDEELSILGLSYDSRRVSPGSAFVAIRGAAFDGHQFIQQALAKGAVAIVAEQPPPPATAATWIEVRDSRVALAKLAANFYRQPTQSLQVIGITGTNGKTTTSLLLEGILREGGHRVGVIGTLAYRWGEHCQTAPMTTPESLDLQQLLHSMRQDQVTHAVMEVSSHALALGRVEGCRFRAAVFTNLSQDHLDFHGNLDDYFAAKALLFFHHLRHAHGDTPPVAVINLDDPCGADLLENTHGEPWSYSIQQLNARVGVKRVEFAADGIRADLVTPAGPLELRSPLLGRLNLYNLLAAATAALALGVPGGQIVSGLAAVASVDGRLQRVPTGRGFEVVVDYAHTPDALEKSLQCLRELTRGRLLVVFGCGGDRDRTKRPLMGSVAATLGDVVIVTSDNPRTEDPHAIIADIEPGLQQVAVSRISPPMDCQPDGIGCYTIEPDRRQAIRLALSWAQPGDLVCIAGKGHETYQIVGREVLPFDDRMVVREWLQTSP
ncbi:MAG TPA: UDP-N-acetylmuramoyl-L-alanyl-D-glutamate--2,6-diaminopimelate ligase [Syntrophobacteraceae bacterium]|nr:UDP-N-acetylmuramoyl-L-alanyl-D-glutamate--2,6-diaminopimelate ligase [Syntrophobacteraceae bacterium]HBZ55553.1 UDP-N-acetylmuramoyl-L-alanyl-D-glutamate--2,6-diaminopimelate ligase [Syntrophobacteraceae bacterium]